MVERENRKQKSRETSREGRIIGVTLAFPEGVLPGECRVGGKIQQSWSLRGTILSTA
jgi:hypothetical protein